MMEDSRFQRNLHKQETKVITVDFASVADARDHLESITLDTEMIQASLSQGWKEGLNSTEYYDWRTRAKFALAYKRSEMRATKRWILEHKNDPDFPADDPHVDSWILYKIIRKYVTWDELTDEEQGHMDRIQLFLRAALGQGAV